MFIVLRLKKHSVFGNHLKYHFFQEALSWYFVLVEVHPPTYAFSFTILGTWEYLWKCNITKLISVFPTSPSAPGWSGVFGSSPDLSALYSAKSCYASLLALLTLEHTKKGSLLRWPIFYQGLHGFPRASNTDPRGTHGQEHSLGSLAVVGGYHNSTTS